MAAESTKALAGSKACRRIPGGCAENGLSGTELFQRVRRKNSPAAVPALTARDATRDKVENFEADADDYLPKPFAIAELLLRIKALLRCLPVQRRHELAFSSCLGGDHLPL
jgi:DNA-binding response OmpR family regulator